MKIESPCIKQCQITDAGLCKGCGRTNNEIAEWLSYTTTKRLSIMKTLKSKVKNLTQT